MARFSKEQILLALYSLQEPVSAQWTTVEVKANEIFEPDNWIYISNQQKVELQKDLDFFRGKCRQAIKMVKECLLANSFSQ